MQKRVMSFNGFVALHTRSNDNKKPMKCHFSESVSSDDMVSMHTRSHDNYKIDILFYLHFLVFYFKFNRS